MEAPLVVLYDGECGVCRAFSRTLGAFNRGGRFRLVPFDEARRLGIASQLSDEQLRASFHVITPEAFVSGAWAVPFVLERLPGGTGPAKWIRGSSVLEEFVRRAYRWVARNRGRVGPCKTCGTGAKS